MDGRGAQAADQAVQVQRLRRGGGGPASPPGRPAAGRGAPPPARVAGGAAPRGGGRRIQAVGIPPPIPRPPKLLCVGLNYRDHAEETKQPIPKVPIFFTKAPTS